MNEHYLIRNADSQEERGPFSLAQLESLVLADQLTPRTLYLDNDEDRWIPFGKNDAIMAILFPEKKKLSLKKQAPPVVIPKKSDLKKNQSESASAIAQHLEEASSLSEVESIQIIEPALLGIVFIISSVGILYPFAKELWQIIFYSNFEVIISDALIALGLFDFLLGVLFFFGGTLIFKVARIRGLIGIGFLCYIYWALEDSQLFYSALLSCLGIIACTYVMNKYFLYASTFLAYVGTIFFAIYSII